MSTEREAVVYILSNVCEVIDDAMVINKENLVSSRVGRLYVLNLIGAYENLSWSYCTNY